MKWGSGCTYPEICMVGGLGCGGQMMFMWGRGSAQEVGVESPHSPVPPAIRVCIAYICEMRIYILAYTENTNNSSITE